ncbi:MAG: ParB N-terminal domain-containing protein [Acidimicrobiales bacterium]
MISALTLDPSLQPRTGGIDLDHVRTLEESMESLPPLLVVRRGEEHVLIDGWHRLAAFQNQGRDRVLAHVAPLPPDGDLRSMAFGANVAHGRPLSLTDRRAEAARRLRIMPQTSDREIGRQCGLSQPTVAKVRAALEAGAQIEHTDARVGKGGYQYAVNARGDGEVAGPDAERLRLAKYLARLTKVLVQGDDLPAWTSPREVAAIVEEFFDEDDAAAVAEVLGTNGREFLNVAKALGLRA